MVLIGILFLHRVACYITTRLNKSVMIWDVSKGSHARVDRYCRTAGTAGTAGIVGTAGTAGTVVRRSLVALRHPRMLSPCASRRVGGERSQD